jgi:Trypsin-co-occurring domain 2
MKVSRGTVQVTDLITVIKNSLKIAGVSKTTPTPDLQVTAVQLTIRTIASRAVGGSIEIRVPVLGMQLRAGAKITHQDVHVLDITLEPPHIVSGQELRGGNVESSLVSAITTIRSVVASAAEGDDPWILSAGTIDLAFVVTETGSLAIGADGELATDVTHTLRLSLAPSVAVGNADQDR